MTFQDFLKEQNITKYHLSKISGVPKSTINDICSGKSSIGKCATSTIYRIALALNCTVEQIMQFDAPRQLDCETGLPADKRYLECGLPPYLKESIEAMKKSWQIIDAGGRDLHWDVFLVRFKRRYKFCRG